MRGLSGPHAGQRLRRQHEVPAARRAGAWLVWWVLLMSLWVIVDDSIAVDELLAGAGAAALAAFLADLVTHQAATRFRIRAGWLAPVLSLPGQVAQGTAMEALVGYEAISSIAVMVLVLLAEGFNRFGELELPIVLAVLLFGSGLVFVHALERWL